MLNSAEHPDGDTPVFTAADMLAQRWRAGRAPKSPPPHTIIVCYQPAAIAALLRRHHAAKVNGFSGELHVLGTHAEPIGVLYPGGPGAPLVAVAVEESIAFGVQRFISIGLAGSLQPELHSGDVVIGDRALRAGQT